MNTPAMQDEDRETTRAVDGEGVDVTSTDAQGARSYEDALAQLRARLGLLDEERGRVIRAIDALEVLR